MVYIPYDYGLLKDTFHKVLKLQRKLKRSFGDNNLILIIKILDCKMLKQYNKYDYKYNTQKYTFNHLSAGHTMEEILLWSNASQKSARHKSPSTWGGIVGQKRWQ